MNEEKPPAKNNVFSMPKVNSEEYNRRKRKPLNPNEIRKRKELIEDLFYQATKLAEQSDNEEALRIYKKIIEIDENNAETLLNIGVIYANLGNLSEAEKYYQQALEIDPNYALANFNMGSLKGELDLLKEEIKYYLKVIEIDPEYADVYYNLGLAWKALGEYKKAIKSYSKYLDLTRNRKNEIGRVLIEEEIRRCEDLERRKEKIK